MIIKKLSYEEYRSNYGGLFWVNPSSFKGEDIQTPFDWKYWVDHKEPETNATTLGSILHEYHLERYKFNNKYIVIPLEKFGSDCKKTAKGFPNMTDKANKDVLSKFKFDNLNKIVLEPEESFYMQGMTEAYSRLKDFDRLLDLTNGETEVSIFILAQFDEDFNFISFIKLESIEAYNSLPDYQRKLLLPCKTRLDYLNFSKTYVMDLKSTTNINPKSFKNDIYKLGYHEQIAFILDAISVELGKQYDTFLCPTVENKPPFNSIFYNASERMIEEGRMTYKRKLEFINKAIKENYYPGLEMFSTYISEDENGNTINRQMIDIDLPEWYYKQKIYGS